MPGANISVNNSSPMVPVVSVSGTTANAIQIGNPTNGALKSLSFGTSGQIF